jgi:hypothetical protein
MDMCHVVWDGCLVGLCWLCIALSYSFGLNNLSLPSFILNMDQDSEAFAQVDLQKYHLSPNATHVRIHNRLTTPHCSYRIIGLRL